MLAFPQGRGLNPLSATLWKGIALEQTSPTSPPLTCEWEMTKQMIWIDTKFCTDSACTRLGRALCIQRSILMIQPALPQLLTSGF